MVFTQLVLAILLGFLYSFEWTTSPTGTKTLLAFIISIQFSGACWTGWNTANDKIDGLEKSVVYCIECLSSCFVLASAIIAEKKEGEEVDLERLTLSLQLTSYSGQMLMVGVFFPMSITVYNSFIIPVFQITWGSDGSKAEIAFQMVTTLLLAPYEILTNFCGLKGQGLGDLMSVAGEFEGSLVEMGASAADVLGGKEDDEDEDEDEDDDDGEMDVKEADAPLKELPDAPTADGAGVGVAIGVGLAPATSQAPKQVMLAPDSSAGSQSVVKEDDNDDKDAEEAIRGPLSAGAKKRLKRAVFLARVRARKTAKDGRNVEAFLSASPPLGPG